MVWEVLDAAWVLHQVQVIVVELLDDFSRGLGVLELHVLYHVVAEVQARLMVHPEQLEAFLVDPAFHHGAP